MSKAILVMDMPSNCKECDMSILSKEPHTGQMCFRCVHHPTFLVETKKTKRPDFCPLRELPEKDNKSYFPDEYSDGHRDGHNACIDELLGEENGSDN